jgi:hypothetical protein
MWRLRRRKAEYPVLPRPLRRQIGEARNPHAVRESAVDSRFDQIGHYGGRSRPVAKELDRLLARALGDGNHTPELSATPLPRAGTILMREWHGITHHVTVTEDGFLWNGKPHRSLSSIARAITGTAWNGPRFFGLREVNSRTPENRHGG